jgi:hypothetical protein
MPTPSNLQVDYKCDILSEPLCLTILLVSRMQVTHHVGTHITLFFVSVIRDLIRLTPLLENLDRQLIELRMAMLPDHIAREGPKNTSPWRR